MGKSGIRVWGSGAAVTVVLAGAGMYYNAGSGMINRDSANTTITAGNGSTIQVNPPSSSRPSPIGSLSSPTPSSPSTPSEQKSKSECKDFGATIVNYTDLISVANRPEKPTARFYLTRSTSRSVVCNIIQSSGELKLIYGIPDNSSTIRVVLKIYLDGKLYKSIDMERGEKIREVVNIANVSGYKVEYSVSDMNSTGGWVYRITE